MKRYAIADEVPEDCDYLTAGKEYEIIYDDSEHFSFNDDNGVNRYSVFRRGSPVHLNGKSWRIVERES